MDMEALVHAFETCELPADRFHHREHVAVAWHYLRRLPLLEALRTFSENLRRFAETHGQAMLYHETITWAFVLLINERMKRSEGPGDWAEFESGNADLFRFRGGALERYYRRSTLDSELARRVFVLPDRGLEAD